MDSNTSGGSIGTVLSIMVTPSDHHTFRHRDAPVTGTCPRVDVVINTSRLLTDRCDLTCHTGRYTNRHEPPARLQPSRSRFTARRYSSLPIGVYRRGPEGTRWQRCL